jgi:hypothetical protein
MHNDLECQDLVACTLLHAHAGAEAESGYCSCSVRFLGNANMTQRKRDRLVNGKESVLDCGLCNDYSVTRFYSRVPVGRTHRTQTQREGTKNQRGEER